MLNLEPASNVPPIPSHLSHLNQLMRGHPAVPEAGARASTIPSSTQETTVTAATSMSSSFSSTTTAIKDKTTGKAEGGKNSAEVLAAETEDVSPHRACLRRAAFTAVKRQGIRMQKRVTQAQGKLVLEVGDMVRVGVADVDRGRTDPSSMVLVIRRR